MTPNDLLKSSFQSLERTKSRSFLTMIGIVIGILSVILMLSIGQAAQRYILSQISALGSDVVFVNNGSKAQSNVPTLFIKPTLTEHDVKKIALQPWVTRVVGRVSQSDAISGEGIQLTAQIVGTSPDELVLSDIRPRVGQFISQASVDSRSREAVLGYELADKLYGFNDPIGKSIKINNASYRVIGVIEKEGTKNFQNLDRQVYIPYTSALDTFNRKNLSAIEVKTTLTVNQAKARLTEVVRADHGIDNPNNEEKKDDFNVTTQEDAVNSASQITQILQILLISIAAISLLVGGIGIMNIMYVSVTERVREIGLRKSIGAREQDILSQFLIEAVVQTTLGGIIGSILGVLLSWALISLINSFQPGWTFAISWSSIALSLGVSSAIGLVFGFFPARKAARLHPMEALRFE